MCEQCVEDGRFVYTSIADVGSGVLMDFSFL